MNSKRLKSFLETNFPSPCKYDIKSNLDDKAVVILDYGRSEPKMRVTIKRTNDAYNLLKLDDTQFI